MTIILDDIKPEILEELQNKATYHGRTLIDIAIDQSNIREMREQGRRF